MIQPVLKDDAFLRSVEDTEPSPNRIDLWWLGQSGYLVAWNGVRFLIDPYLSNSLTKKYADTDKPHIRMTERVVAPERLTDIAFVTSSHNHTDHLDAETLLPLMETNPGIAIIAPTANIAFAADRLNVSPERLIGTNAGESVEIAGVRVNAVPAAHESIERDERGNHRYQGYVFEVGPFAVYHSGDTVRYEGMVERLSAWRLDAALLPINGRDPKRGVAGNLWGREAARLAKEIGARLAIPNHYEMFTFNTATPDEFIRESEEVGQPYAVMKCGERRTLMRE